MTWRVIVHIGYTGSGERSQLYNPIAKYLRDCGLKRIWASRTWKGQAVNAVKVAKQFTKLLDLLSDPAKNGVSRAELDRLWIYIDQAEKPKTKNPAR